MLRKTSTEAKGAGSTLLKKQDSPRAPLNRGRTDYASLVPGTEGADQVGSRSWYNGPYDGRTFKACRRLFDGEALNWLTGVKYLRDSGMSLDSIKEYVELCLEGDSTIEERLAIVLARRDEIDRQLEELKLARDFIEYKCWFYEVAKESGTCDAPKSIPIEELPPDIARIKKKCRINRY